MDIDKLLAETQWLRALARSLVQDEDRAEEITQETLLVALEKSPPMCMAWNRSSAVKSSAYPENIGPFSIIYRAHAHYSDN